MAEHEEELVDGAGLVGGIPLRPDAEAAQAVERARPQARLIEEDAAVFRAEYQAGDVQIALGRADDRVAQPAFEIEAPGVIEQKGLPFPEVGPPETVAAVGEEGQAFGGEHLSIGAAIEL